MAYAFASASTQYMTVSATPVTNAPMTMAAFFNPDNTTDACILFQLSDGTTSNRFMLLTRGDLAGDPFRIQMQTTLVTAFTVDATTAFQSAVWQHGAGKFNSNSSRTVFLDGGNSATDTTSATADGINQINIGYRLNAGSPGVLMNGKLAEIAFWSVALTDREIVSVAKGFKPTRVRPQSLVFYAPLVRNVVDLSKNKYTITSTNSPTVADHPRVY